VARETKDGTENRSPERPRLDAAATAALLALAIATWTAVAWPWTGRGQVDALVNEWIIWFTVCYLALVGGTALAGRLRRRRRPGVRPDP